MLVGLDRPERVQHLPDHHGKASRHRQEQVKRSARLEPMAGGAQRFDHDPDDIYRLARRREIVRVGPRLGDEDQAAERR